MNRRHIRKPASPTTALVAPVLQPIQYGAVDGAVINVTYTWSSAGEGVVYSIMLTNTGDNWRFGYGDNVTSPHNCSFGPGVHDGDRVRVAATRGAERVYSNPIIVQRP
jgi:hypothetical protein